MKEIIKLLVAFFIVGCASVQISAASTKISEKNFPDNFLRIYIKNKFDTNKDGKLSAAEKEKVKKLDVSEVSEFQLDYEYPAPYTLKGIEFFSELEELNCSDCALSQINTKRNKKLIKLYCNKNELKKLDVSKNKKLEVLACSNNKISSLSLKNNCHLKEVFCDSNKIRKINVLKNTKLEKLSISDNQIESIDIHSLGKLVEFYCDRNKIRKLDVTKNRKLLTFNCYGNRIKKLVLKMNKNLDYLACSENQLTKLDLSNNRLLQYLFCEKNCLLTGNIKISYSQFIRADISPQKQTIRVKKIGKYYYVPLKGVNRTNEIVKLSAGTMTEKGIRLKGKKLPKKITYEYNMFTDGEERTKVEIKVKRRKKK